MKRPLVLLFKIQATIVGLVFKLFTSIPSIFSTYSPMKTHTWLYCPRAPASGTSTTLSLRMDGSRTGPNGGTRTRCHRPRPRQPIRTGMEQPYVVLTSGEFMFILLRDKLSFNKNELQSTVPVTTLRYVKKSCQYC